MKTNVPIIGGHVSANGGVANTVLNAKRIGAEAIQFFGASPQTWAAKQPTTDDIRQFREAYAKSGLKAAYLHAAYLVNLASSNDIFFLKSVKSLVDHLRIADALGIDGLIFHIGSSKGISRESALEQEVEGMKKVLAGVPASASLSGRATAGKPGAPYLLMENTAGGGEKIGATIEETAYLFKKVNSPRVKICFDTAHAFEAGLVSEYTEKSVKKLFDDWDAAVGLENITVIHANDSKTTADSHHDRHENIGEGHIGMKGFRALASDTRLYDKVWLLEVPGFDDGGPDKKNIEILERCFSQ